MMSESDTSLILVLVSLSGSYLNITPCILFCVRPSHPSSRYVKMAFMRVFGQVT